MLITVLMSVYNTEERWLRAAVDSILRQTIEDFEFIIVTDCPSDNSVNIIKEYAIKDRRIRLIENENNMGLTKSLNRGLGLAKGKYIARMDADDISLPYRFERQVRYLEDHEEAVAVGCRCSTTNTRIPVLNDWIDDTEIMRIRMLFRNAGLPHPTAMIRHEVLKSNSLRYTEWVKKSQDYKLWVDLLPFGKLVLLPDILFIYREHASQVSANGASLTFAHQIAIEQAENFLGKMTDREKELHCTASEIEIPQNDVRGLANYYDRLLKANSDRKLYDQEKLKIEIDYMWCQKAFRRLKILKSPDMLLNKRTLHILHPTLFKYVRENKKRTTDYVDAIKRFQQGIQNNYIQE